MIKVSKLNKSFGSVNALSGLSFEIKKGEIVGFLGPNGAGKTTTMRLLTGYLSPDSGSISIDGKNIDDNLQLAQSKIGYLPENNPLYKDMLVSETLDFAADLKHIPTNKIKSSLDFVVNALGIDDVFYRQIGELSKGYKQRVGMAMALLHKPKILIMDEPTEGLDPNQRTEIRSLIKDLAKERTIILSTHVMGEANAVATRLLIINQGKLVADGTPQQLAEGSSKEKTVELEIQGTKISTTLKKLKYIKVLKSTRLKSNRYQITLSVKTSKNIQPQLSKLAVKHKWVIWKLTEPENNLEDIFHQLTSTKK